MRAFIYARTHIQGNAYVDDELQPLPAIFLLLTGPDFPEKFIREETSQLLSHTFG
jgi:hypothetical protein